MTYKRCFVSFLLAALIISVSGCGEKIPANIPKLFPASITVTMDGKPLEGATVTLAGLNPTLPVGGVTDTSGTVKILTQAKYNGAPAGKYKVYLSKIETVEGPTSKTPPPRDSTQLDAYRKQLWAERQSFEIVGEEFRAAATTPLEFEVNEGKNTASLEVTRTPGT